MPMIRSRLVDIPVYRGMDVKSGYVGTERTWEQIDTVQGDRQPGVNKRTAEQFGERAVQMDTVYLTSDANLLLGDGMCGMTQNKTPQYLVVQLLSYRTHKVAVIERQADA